MTARSAFDISQDESWQLMEQFSAIHGEPIATKNNGFGGLDAELTFNKTKFVKFVTDLKSWYDQGLAKIKSPNTGEDYVAAFAAGHCQMTLTSVGDHGNIGRTADPDMHWDVAMLPVYDGTERHNSFVGGASLWVLQGPHAGGVQGGGGVPELHRPARAGAVLVDRDRLHPGHQDRLRLHEGQRLLRQGALQGPRDRHCQSLNVEAAGQRAGRHPPRQLPADPRRARRTACRRSSPTR